MPVEIEFLGSSEPTGGTVTLRLEFRPTPDGAAGRVFVDDLYLADREIAGFPAPVKIELNAKAP